VVETGNPIYVASASHVEEPIKAHIIPNIRTSGWLRKLSTLTIDRNYQLLLAPKSDHAPRYILPILLRMVSATRAPTVTAPANSMTLAIIIACINVRDREETEVAKEFATSLAPMQ
jgi:hypothetical protein